MREDIKKKIYTLMAIMACYSLHSEPIYKINWTLDSAHLDSQRTVTIQLPQTYYSQSSYDYPVLYLLDGENNLDYTHSVVEFLAENGETPELIIVAITGGIHRNMDYLPLNPQTGDVSDGAEKFLKFITTELIPKVDNDLRAAPFRMISGHSYGGIFVAYALVNGINHFNGFISQSPYFDDTMGPALIENIQSTLNENKQKNIYYYMNIGLEPNLAKGFNSLEKIFNKDDAEQHQLISQKDPQKTHMTTRLVGQYEGLEHLFKNDWSLSNRRLAGKKFDGLNEHIEKLSKKFGYPVLYNEKYFATATQILLSMQDAELAKKTSEFHLKQYPKSVLANFMGANVHAIMGDKVKALEHVNKALSLQQSNPNKSSEPMMNQLKQMKRGLSQ